MASVSGQSNNASVSSNGNSTISSSEKQNVCSPPAIYQGVAICLKDPDKKYEDKVCAVLSAWERLASFSTSSSHDGDIHAVTEFLYRDTLLLVLRVEWTKLPVANKTHLSVTLQRTTAAMSDVEAQLLCTNVSRLVQNPWDHPVLKKILYADPDLTEAEALEFFLMETAEVLTMRLDLLCKDKCESLALELVRWCRKCLALPSGEHFLEGCSLSHQQHWIDLHVALLSWSKKHNEVFRELNELPLEEGRDLVQRFTDRGTSSMDSIGNNGGGNNASRLWRNSLKIAQLASQIFMARALRWCPPPECLSSLTKLLVRLEDRMGTSTPKLIEMLHKLVDHGDLVTSAHMYTMCAALSQESLSELDQGQDLRPLCIELYVRAVAVDVNDLEKRKHRGEGHVTAEVRQAEISLAAQLSALANLVKAQVGICRECVLTAFSLHPTQERFDQLAQLAAAPDSIQFQEQRPQAHQSTIGTTAAPISDNAVVADCPSVIELNRVTVVGEPPPGSGGGPGGGLSCVRLSDDGAVGFNLPFTTMVGSGSAIKTEALTSEDADSGVDLSEGIAGGEQESLLGSSTSPPLPTLPSSSPLSSSVVSSPYSIRAALDLGVSKQIIDDLASVVHSCRWAVLNWNLGWEELRLLCLRYLEGQAEMRCITKELKYLPTLIDYSQFEHIPRIERDENYGIEKGYELRTSEDDNVSHSQREQEKHHQQEVDTSVGLRRRRKPNLPAAKRSSYPASESSDAESNSSVCTISGIGGTTSSGCDLKKKVLKKKLLRRIKALKTSSDSDSQSSTGHLASTSSTYSSLPNADTKVKSPKTAKSLKSVRTTSSRVLAHQVRKVHPSRTELTFPPPLEKSARLIKTLRMLRPEFACANGSSWSDPSLQTQQLQPSRMAVTATITSSSSLTSLCPSSCSEQLVSISCSSNNRNTLQSSTSSRSPSMSLSPTSTHTDHFAPMLSTLNMNPKIVLTRTPVSIPLMSPVKNTDVKTIAATAIENSASLLTESSSNQSQSGAQKILTYNIGSNDDHRVMVSGIDPLRPYVLLERLEKVSVVNHLRGFERTMASLKGIDMFQVRPPPTAVHMVQLPNPPTTTNHVATTNGLVSSTSNVGPAGTNGGTGVSAEQSQDDSTKGDGGSSSTSVTEDSIPFSSNNNSGISNPDVSTGPSLGSTLHSLGQEALPSTPVTASESVTLVSTPSVSIFQVAHRPTHHSAAVTLQPVAAVTGFNHPPPTAPPTPSSNTGVSRVKNSGGRGRARVSVRTPSNTVDAAAVSANPVVVSSNADLSDTAASLTTATVTAIGQQLPIFNGPINANRGQGRAEPGRAVRAARRDSQSNETPVIPSSVVAMTAGGSSVTDTGLCRVPLVKYVDLDAVSSPTRPRPTGTIGMRRQSQGSNSNSPDPHQQSNRSSTTGKSRNASGATISPASPALSSPQSPALQAPPSPLPYRKQQPQQHYGVGTNQKTSGDRLASPSHPSQCSSPFSRPSSRSQEASPSSSEPLGTMHPPSFLPYASADSSGSILTVSGGHPTAGLTSNRAGCVNSNFSGAVSPNQQPTTGCLPALPKFQQAFGRKSLNANYDILPSGMMGSASSHQDATQIQESVTVNRGVTTATSSSASPSSSSTAPLVGNGFTNENIRNRFTPVVTGCEQHQQVNPPAEDEGLGSKLHSLLESALNGQISRSPTRQLQTPSVGQHLQQQTPVSQQQQSLINVVSPEPLLNASVTSMDAQLSESEGGGSGNYLLSEQLREFESVFERVASTSHLKDSQQLPTMAAWATDLTAHAADPDDIANSSYSMTVGPVAISDYLAPTSNYSGSVDAISATSPVTVSRASTDSSTHSSVDDIVKVSEAETEFHPNQPINTESDAPLMLTQLLTVASAARQALADEENCCNSNSSSSTNSSSNHSVQRNDPELVTATALPTHSRNGESPTLDSPKQHQNLELTPKEETVSHTTDEAASVSVGTSGNDIRVQVAQHSTIVSDDLAVVASSAVVINLDASGNKTSDLSYNSGAIANGSDSSTTCGTVAGIATPPTMTTAATSSTTTVSSTTSVRTVTAPNTTVISVVNATPPETAKTNRTKQTSSKNSPAVSPSVTSGGSSPSKSSGATAISPACTAIAIAVTGTNKPPPKAHDDEVTVSRVNAILEEYREQLRNSPDLQNKPAPRRRSNPLPSPSTTPKRRKSVQSKVKLLSQHTSRTGDAATHSSAASTTPASVAGSPSSTAVGATRAVDGSPIRTAASGIQGKSVSDSVQVGDSSTCETANPTLIGTPTKLTEALLTVQSMEGSDKATASSLSDNPTGTQSAAVQSNQMTNNETAFQLSIPNQPIASVNTETSSASRLIQSSFTHSTTSDGSGNGSGSSAQLTVVSAAASLGVPITMQQLLVTSQAGVRQVLLPISNVADLRQALVAGGRGTGSTTTRFISVRQLTMGGQIFGLPARLTTPITVRAVPSNNSSQPAHQPDGNSVVATNNTGDQDPQAQIQDLLTTPRCESSTTGPLHWVPSTVTTTSGVTGRAGATSLDGDSGVVAALSGPVTTVTAFSPTETPGTVLRLVPTVSRVNLPTSSDVDAANTDSNRVLDPLSATSTTTTPPTTTTTNTTNPTSTLTSTRMTARIASPEAESLVAWNNQTGDENRSSPGPSSSIGEVAIPVPLVTGVDEKLLSDAETAGVSDFLPCADFMGPSVSPSPCFSFSDSPLGKSATESPTGSMLVHDAVDGWVGSQNSSPVASPVALQVLSAEEDSNNAADNGLEVSDSALLQRSRRRPPSFVGGESGSGDQQSANRSKILKRNEKPRVVLVRNDHGGMEYRRVSDASVDGPGIIRTSLRKSFGRKQTMAKQIATAVAATASTASPPSTVLSNEKPSDLQISTPPPTDKGASAQIKEDTVRKSAKSLKNEANTEVELKAPAIVIPTSEPAREPPSGVLKSKNLMDDRSSPLLVGEASTPELAGEPRPMDPVAPALPPGVTPDVIDNVQRRQSRRCTLQKKEHTVTAATATVIKMETDSGAQDRTPLKTKRRSSTRGNVKKNCSCCASGNGSSPGHRKRSKSETSSGAGDCLSSFEVSCSPAKKAAPPEMAGVSPSIVVDAGKTEVAATSPAAATAIQSTSSKAIKTKKNAQRKK